jgi:hypothetical protein
MMPGMADDETGGPYLQTASFCEKVLIEAGGVASLIRLVDRFVVNGSTPELQPTLLSFYMVVSFKSGFIRGKHTVKIVPFSPSKVEMPTFQAPQLFEGDDRGVMLAAEMKFQVQEEGVYWFDVYFETQLFTRMPLRVIYQQTSAVQMQMPPTGN